MAMKYTKTYVDWSQVPLVLSVSDVCVILRTTDRTVRNYLDKKKLKGVRVDNKWYVKKENLVKFLDGQ